MNFHSSRSWVLLATAAASLLVVSGCATREEVVVRERVAVPAHPPVVRAMPAAIREDRGPRPGPDWGWVPGHWKWEGNNWAWVHGRWIHEHVPPMPALIVEQSTIAPSPHHYWVPGHWVWRFDASGWVWVSGHWQI